MRLEIVGLAGGGRGVARENSKVWLVAGALPGEVVDVAVERRRAGIIEARCVGVLTPSPWRSADPCPVAGRCGGCDLDHVAPEARTEVAKRVVLGALRHAPPSLAGRMEQARVMTSGERWRLRSRLHWDAAAGTLGFRAHRSHEVARIHQCRIVSDRLVGQLAELEAALRGASLPDGEMEWIETLDGASAVAGWWDGGGKPPRFAGVEGFWRVSRGSGLQRSGWGARGVVMALPSPLFVPVGAFFQANRFLIPRLFERVADAVRGSGQQTVVDLYGGVGFLAAAARVGGADRVTVVETNALAAAAAQRNVPRARVVASSCEEMLAREAPGREALVIADPPRVGLSRRAVSALVGWAPRRIMLLSCDAARFGRDADALLQAGYDLEELELWDMFPGTHHVEIFSIFAYAGT